MTPAPIERRLLAASGRVVVTDARPARAQNESELLGEKHLTRTLQERLETAIGTGRAQLVVRVKLLEAREIPEQSLVVRAVLEVAVEQGGRILTTTRGTSTLHGSVGGMAPQTEERVEAAIVDAFERSVLRPVFIDTTNAALDAAAEPDAAREAIRVDETRHAWLVRGHESAAAAHVLSAVFDGGQTYAFGARYLHDHLVSGSGLIWGGYGLEGRLISYRFERLDAMAGLAIVRGGFGVEHALSVELGLGAGGRDDVRAVGIAGAYLSFYYLDLGFTEQFVISKTAELAPLQGHHFGIRINIPIQVHGETVRCRSPLPCHPELFPSFNARSQEAGPRR